MPISRFCTKNAKTIILIVNAIFVLIGVVLLSVGISVVGVASSFQSNYADPLGRHAREEVAAAALILLVGLIILLISLFGFYAIIREYLGCLTIYTAILVFLIILQVIAALLSAGTLVHKIVGIIDESMLTMLRIEYGEQDHNASTEVIDRIQTMLQCCGVTNDGPLDWKNSNWYNHSTNGTLRTVPDTCCITNGTKGWILNRTLCITEAYNTSCSERLHYVYTEGCGDKVNQILEPHTRTLFGLVITFIIIEILLLILTCCLESSIPRRGYDSV